MKTLRIERVPRMEGDHLINFDGGYMRSTGDVVSSLDEFVVRYRGPGDLDTLKYFSKENS